MSLVPEKKSTENGFKKIAAVIVFVIGCICLTWFLFHIIYAGVMGVEYDFMSANSLGRLVLGFIMVTMGYAMFKFIDWEYNRPRPR